MSRLFEKEINHSLADGDVTTPAINSLGSLCTALLKASSLSGDGVKATLQTSPDNETFADAPDGEATIKAADPAAMWNIALFPRGTFFRVKVEANGVTGNIDIFKLLTDEG